MNELHARVVRVGLAVCVMQGATIAAAAAGPCTAQIEQIDKALSQSGSKWNVGPTGQQTTAADAAVGGAGSAVGAGAAQWLAGTGALARRGRRRDRVREGGRADQDDDRAVMIG